VTTRKRRPRRMKLRLGKSIWPDRHRTRLAEPILRGRHAADVAIVGGGITGTACAYLLARAGARVVLVDAGSIGLGSTAASTALLMQEPDVDFRDLAALYGTRVAAIVWRRSRGAVRGLVRTLRHVSRQSMVHSLPSVYLTRDDARSEDLREEVALRRRAGIDARWLTPERVRASTGVWSSGGILMPGNAQADPYRACLALAGAAISAGARIYARSRVRRTETSADGVRLVLDRGEVRAAQVIVATGYATSEFKPLLGRFTMYTTYALTTPRLPASLRRRLGFGDVMWWDTEKPYHYARWTRDGRMLFGGEDRRHGTVRSRRDEIAKRVARLVEDLGGLYPLLRDIEPEYAWEGLFATTPDGLPYIGRHRRYPKHLFALGYAGNGMTFGFLAAQALERAVRGRPEPEDALFAFTRMRRAAPART
jgi:glycine/D-amino acid oxidase-like deaminating enzyme